MQLTVVMRLGPPHSHLISVVAMKGVALDEHGRDLLAPENLIERPPDARRARARGACDGNDGMLGGHEVRSFSDGRLSLRAEQWASP